MFELVDIIGIILCIVVCIISMLTFHYCLKTLSREFKKTEDERVNLSLEYKYQIERLITELDRLIERKKNER